VVEGEKRTYITFGCERYDVRALSKIGTKNDIHCLKVNSINKWWGGKYEQSL
jgi:hypothetical protein